jgi:hypothetical protein
LNGAKKVPERSAMNPFCLIRGNGWNSSLGCKQLAFFTPLLGRFKLAAAPANLSSFTLKCALACRFVIYYWRVVSAQRENLFDLSNLVFVAKLLFLLRLLEFKGLSS